MAKIAYAAVTYAALTTVAGIGLALGSLVAETRSQTGRAETRPETSSQVETIKQSLPNYFRAEDQTFLVLPEWYIVYSADEYAAFLENNPPSGFPYFSAIRQFWSSYSHIYGIVKGRYPFNYGYHLGNVVIGTSFSLEYLVKGTYENTIGRLAEWLSSRELTEEDKIARQVAKEYGDFVHTTPWYEFPFGTKLKQLWRDTSWWGANALRKWERKWALTMEYGFKAVYAWVIKLGTQVTYAPEDLEILSLVKNLPKDTPNKNPAIRIVKEIGHGSHIVALPRYEKFTRTVPELIKQGVQFVEIAGNDEILITVMAPRDSVNQLADGDFLFAMEILTQPELKRIAVRARVKALHKILAGFESRGLKLEHIYDY